MGVKRIHELLSRVRGGEIVTRLLPTRHPPTRANAGVAPGINFNTIGENMKKVTEKEICRLYQTGDNLWEVASKLDELAQEVPTFDQEDHDWGKDAGHFHWDYLKAVAGETNYYWRELTPDQFLMKAIDTLLAGCHALASPADWYIEGGTDLLDAVFSWDGTGNLYQWYKSRHRRE